MLNDVMDLRVVKTLENIKNGFAICINQKKFTSITIKDITTAAKINRSTFYKYYHDKYDLRELLVKSTLEELSNSIGSGFFNLKYNEIYQSKNELSQEQELFARLFAASAMTTIKWWYTYSQNMSPKDIADIIIDNITIGMHRAFFQNIRTPGSICLLLFVKFYYHKLKYLIFSTLVFLFFYHIIYLFT
ncbi:transcriptional regulator, TetR family [Clostridium acidisoli DSM 12555]|uniref:Transcriptional regulator, TetR family n=1 Tax=Clostridium acidisoli DSM 12555 TaxID=1121291 RepID=A0A1W1XJ20_9CLOT|nr:TetR/AcrR family transcriptional regulator [Clostridium acidisoli]SMC23976.1 transcriptional regulator, TetR family [Clostridium acidisoli DSM 12555]